MKTTMVLFTATMIASLTMAAAEGPSREEQYRAKYGRYTPAYETRLKAEPAAAAPAGMENAVPDCCRSLRAGTAILAEERNRVKYGRYSPAKEAQAEKALVELAVHGQACRVLDHCPLPMGKQPVVAAVTSSDARLLAKYGRVFTVKNAPVAILAARHSEPCEHACCQSAE